MTLEGIGAPEILAVRCIERRQTDKLLEKKFLEDLKARGMIEEARIFGVGKVVMLSNAGAVAPRIPQNILKVLEKNPTITEIVLLPHGQGCGGMALARSVCGDLNNKGLDVFRDAIRPIEKVVELSRDQRSLEEVDHPNFEVKWLEKLVKDNIKDRVVKVRSMLLMEAGEGHDHGHGRSDEEHSLLITKYTGIDYENVLRVKHKIDLEKTYILQYFGDISEVRIDMLVAAKVLTPPIRDVKLFGVPTNDLLVVNKTIGQITGMQISDLSSSKSRSVN